MCFFVFWGCFVLFSESTHLAFSPTLLWNLTVPDGTVLAFDLTPCRDWIIPFGTVPIGSVLAFHPTPAWDCAVLLSDSF